MTDEELLAAVDAVLDHGTVLPGEALADMTEAQKWTYSRAIDRRHFAVTLEMQRMRERHPGLPLPDGVPHFMFVSDVPDDPSSIA
ncbi:hypothetical protein [Pseudonocardia sp. MH-G8]|uniref:hypothetical protein n=1 Tax=Pseudonocardia sp. MH-G8 TaxID=1854588 RepID=UPI000B9FFDD5|nr:hypothetical protein [Pseudonocardia sp. MH-G8]OZM81201.1 hypothetical protein CFP66_17675 [Pseudonocardia sp. MH-G8]